VRSYETAFASQNAYEMRRREEVGNGLLNPHFCLPAISVHCPTDMLYSEKESYESNAHGLNFGAAAMQGWRVEMEDAHTVIETMGKTSGCLGRRRRSQPPRPKPCWQQRSGVGAQADECDRSVKEGFEDLRAGRKRGKEDTGVSGAVSDRQRADSRCPMKCPLIILL
jgi:hypothetical protein